MSREYTEAVRRNILPLSVSRRLPDAFTEWRFTGHTKDHRSATEVCRLCEQENIRYHFKILNDRTRATLWVGSRCILKFGIGIYENGQRLAPARARSRLNRLVEEMRQEACLAALDEVAAEEGGDILRNALRYYRENGYLTPKFGAVVLWRLSANGIEHNPSFFKISLRREKYREDLCEMSLRQVHTIWPALTPSQRRTAEECGHAPPPAG